MKSLKTKMTFYLSEKANEFLKQRKNKTALINKALEDLALKEKKEAFISQLHNYKPSKAKMDVITALQKARSF